MRDAGAGWAIFIILSAFPLPAGAQEKLPRFRQQVVEDKFGDLWEFSTADVNGDGKPDIIALNWSPARVVWYENPTWKKRIVFENHPEMPVCLKPLDVDGDGKVEIILGAGYHEPPDPKKGGGGIWLLKRPDDLNKPWIPIPIDAEPTIHRMRLIDLEGKGRKEVVCSALHGPDGAGAALFILKKPADPFKDPWTREPVSRELHTLHNTWSVDWDGDGKEEGILAAAQEGIFSYRRGAEGAWKKVQRLGEGSQGKNRGSSEVAVGRLPGGQRYLAAMEPHHGREAAIYTPPDDDPHTLWKRRVLIEDNKGGGHTVWPADLTGTGVDSVLLGFVGGRIFYIFHPLDGKGEKWEKIVLDDDPEISGEDGSCVDLNGDGRIDIVVAGRAKIKVYWNEGR